MSVKTMFESGWQREMFWLCILYRIVECKDIIPVDTADTKYSFLENPLFRMAGEGLVELGGPCKDQWNTTKKGKEALGKLVAVFDNSLKFEIFGHVEIGLLLGDDETDEEGEILDHLYDRRFDPERDSDTTYDLRIAMMSYLSDQMVASGDLEQAIDPHRVVFVQKLADGEFDTNDFWTDLAMGLLHKQVGAIVDSAYMHTDIAESAEGINNTMQAIYTLGMLEQRKRDGEECSECNIPLGIFEMNAREEDETLDTCPNPDCDGVFIPPPPEYKYECPNCEQGLFGQERTCPGCGARVDFAMPAGTIKEEVEETTETVVEHVYDPWGSGYAYYDYMPYGYYDPYDPFMDVLAFGCVAAVIF